MIRILHAIIFAVRAIYFWFIVSCIITMPCMIDAIIARGYKLFAIILTGEVILICFLYLFYTKKDAYKMSGLYLIDKLVDGLIWKIINEEEENNND